jgi:hypothetical protein
MYDILQLNDMLVPELLDVAEQLQITSPKKLGKQELIYKILDKQAVMSSETQDNAGDKSRRKRIVKTSTANSTEEAEVMKEPEKETRKAAPAKEAADAKKKPQQKSLQEKKLKQKMRNQHNRLSIFRRISKLFLMEVRSHRKQTRTKFSLQKTKPLLPLRNNKDHHKEENQHSILNLTGSYFQKAF